jgi:hypothetical protein
MVWTCVDKVLAIRTCGLIGGSPRGCAPCEFLGESSSCLPFDGWWIEPTLGTWVSKLLLIRCMSILIGTMVVIEVVTYCWMGSLSLLMTIWTIVVNWFPIICGMSISGMTCYFGTRCKYLGT